MNLIDAARFIVDQCDRDYADIGYRDPLDIDVLRKALAALPSTPPSERVMVPRELLRELRDNAKASVAETDITEHRRAYRVGLERRASAILTDSQPTDGTKE